MRHPVERELAGHLVRLCPGLSYAAFFKTGSDAVHAAITTAVKATGRTVVLTTTYHGWLMPLGELRTASGLSVRGLDWTSPALAAEVAASARDAACVVVSPTPDTPGQDAIAEVVAAARVGGAVVIFDEVKAGFRYAYPTTAASLGIEPDLIVVSKAIGNGFPIAAVLGGDLMADEKTFSVFSTYASELVSLTASLACLRALADGEYDIFARQSAALHANLGSIGAKYGVEVAGVPTFFRLSLPEHLDAAGLSLRLYDRGVLYHPYDQVLVSAAHDDGVIERVCAAFDDSLRDMT